MSVEWTVLLSTTAMVLLLLCVALGVVPVLMTAFQYLILPLHGFINHYAKAGYARPHIAVIVPAWNEGLVIGATIDRLLTLDYPAERLRVYVVDDASTDATPDIVLAKAAEHPGRVFHVRRDTGGEGKAHTLNHGIARVLAEPWAEAILIMDADVIFAFDSLRKMTRHFADPKVGAVTAYIAEGSMDRNYITRFIGIEYVMAQLASRRAQNVLGAIACLAGGAQLHTRENLEAIGGRIPTGTLAEDTMATFESQLRGRRMVFEPHAVVFAEEPRTIDALWKQRLRWARGNLQVTRHYRRLWFRRSRVHELGSISFGLTWFSVLLLPALMTLAAVGLLGLMLLHSGIAAFVFGLMWITAALVFLFSIAFAVQLDPRTGRSSWREAILFPGIGSLVLMAVAVFPESVEQLVFDPLGIDFSGVTGMSVMIAMYVWGPVAMLGAWLARIVERVPVLGWVLSRVLVYLVGYGALLCAITTDSYIKEWRRADASWSKTEKVGRVMG